MGVRDGRYSWWFERGGRVAGVKVLGGGGRVVTRGN